MNQDIFHIMKTNRPMRRSKTDPVPQALLEEILDAASCAPNSMSSQPYEFLIVRATATKAFFGERYDVAIHEAFAAIIPAEDDNSRSARNLRAALALGKRLKDVPVLLFICGVREWPFAVSHSDRVGLAPPSYGSVYPCIQNIFWVSREGAWGQFNYNAPSI